MNQSLTPSPTSKAIYSTVTSKGQVTIPAEVRKHLGIAPNEKIAFIIQPQGTVEIRTPKYPTLASLRGAAGKLKKPLTWKAIEAIVRDDRAEAYARKNH